MLGTGFSIGVDQTIFFGLGFLVCAVLAIIPIPFIHARAVRLTEKNLAHASPVAMKDIQAEKDRMRAEFAMSARRLETGIDELRTKASVHLTELAKKSSIIAKLKTALEEREAAIARLETSQETLECRVKALFDDLQAAKADAAFKTDEILQAERVVAHNRNQLTDLRLAIGQRERVIERQSAEIAALRNDARHARVNGGARHLAGAE